LWLIAVDAPAPDSQTAIILGVIGLLTAVLVALATGVFSLLSARANRTEPAPPSPVPVPAGDHVLYERIAVLERRADDSDERDEVQDRRLDQVERRLDIDNPEWRHDGH
jgi:hypothetical protein